MILTFLLNIVYDIFYNLPVVYVKDILNRGSDVYGYIQTALSLGMLTGAAIIGLKKFNKIGAVYIISIFIYSIIIFFIGINKSLFVALMLYFAFSFSDALSIPCFT
jgi:NhaP-type Na+/H+ and K+/H+ antiporter